MLKDSERCKRKKFSFLWTNNKIMMKQAADNDWQKPEEKMMGNFIKKSTTEKKRERVRSTKYFCALLFLISETEGRVMLKETYSLQFLKRSIFIMPVGRKKFTSVESQMFILWKKLIFWNEKIKMIFEINEKFWKKRKFILYCIANPLIA